MATRFCVVSKKTGRTSRCFGSMGKARTWCGRLNKLCRCRDFTVKQRRTKRRK